MEPFAIVGIALGGFTALVTVVMVACIPVFKAQARRQAKREELKLRIKEEREFQKLEEEKAKAEMEFKFQKERTEMLLENERNKSAVFCTYCGTKNKPNSAYCKNCGAALS